MTKYIDCRIEFLRSHIKLGEFVKRNYPSEYNELVSEGVLLAKDHANAEIQELIA